MFKEGHDMRGLLWNDSLPPGQATDPPFPARGGTVSMSVPESDLSLSV